MDRDVLTLLEERLDEQSARGLAGAVTRAMRDGELSPGAKLPPIRTVAQQLHLSPTTVSAGWALLLRSGAIRTDGRRGTTVADIRAAGPARYRRTVQRHDGFALDLSSGIPDPKLLPDLGPALHRLRSAPVPGSYLDDPVLPELLDLLRADWPYPAEEITVVDGAMDALELAAVSLLRFGDRVVVEHPSFPPLLDLLDTVGAEIVGVPVDAEGISPEPLARALAEPVSAVFLQPRAQNPTGVSMTAERAEHLAAILAPGDCCVVEDDSAGAVASTPDISLGSWLPTRTLHVRSYSKSHGPDLRLAAMSGPAALLDALIGRRQLGQGWSSRLLQQVLASLLHDPRAVRRVERARVEYARRRSRLCDALATHGVAVGGRDGFNVWVPVRDESAALLRLASHGVAVAPGAPFTAPGVAATDEQGHVRVTVGLLASGHRDLAADLAAAAQAPAWNGAR